MNLDNVSFSYPRNPERVVLKNCSLQIMQSEKIAIVGRNGAGKSTILKLLAKVYLPTSGSVSINDSNIENITQESWLNHLVYITQGAGVNDLQLKEALTGSSNPDMNRLIEASKLAGTHELIMGRKKGYDLQIRSHWERGGEDFSGGEYQRLALVSVFYRLLDEKVFVGFFDEPMSNCDNETRNRFYKAINSIPNKTIVAVAHDHHYLHYFERVVEIKDSCVYGDMRDPESIAAFEIRSSHRESVKID
jgi:ABC-type bacteriocin/lantibiotic exporter with double-glycine peptidase domain